MNAFSTNRLRRLPQVLTVCAAALVPAACAGGMGGGPGGAAYYQTAYPAYDTSEMLRQTFGSVRRIQITAIYETYTFAAANAPTEGNAITSSLLAAAIDTVSAPQERAATAVALSRTGGNVALLTADHALEFPDTIVQLFDEQSDGPGTPARPVGSRRIETVSVKTHQTNWVVGSTLDAFEVLARDPVRDLALVGIREPVAPPNIQPVPGPSLQQQANQSPVLTLPAGDSDQLSWGSFVYVLGHPQGYPMVTRGIVSAPDFPTPGSFLVDGLWNRGMSGGLILASRGTGQGLEWVGIARSAAASTEVRLTPERGAEPQPGVRRPYDGQLYLEEYRQIDYGITLSIPMTEIRRFLDERRTALVDVGFVLPRI